MGSNLENLWHMPVKATRRGRLHDSLQREAELEHRCHTREDSREDHSSTSVFAKTSRECPLEHSYFRMVVLESTKVESTRLIALLQNNSLLSALVAVLAHLQPLGFVYWKNSVIWFASDDLPKF